MDDNNTASQEELEPLKKYLLLQKNIITNYTCQF